MRKVNSTWASTLSGLSTHSHSSKPERVVPSAKCQVLRLSRARAAAASSLPWPWCWSQPGAPRSTQVERIMSAVWLGVSSGSSESMSAAVADTWAAAMLVPSPHTSA